MDSIEQHIAIERLAQLRDRIGERVLSFLLLRRFSLFLRILAVHGYRTRPLFESDDLN